MEMIGGFLREPMQGARYGMTSLLASDGRYGWEHGLARRGLDLSAAKLPRVTGESDEHHVLEQARLSLRAAVTAAQPPYVLTPKGVALAPEEPFWLHR